MSSLKFKATAGRAKCTSDCRFMHGWKPPPPPIYSGKMSNRTIITLTCLCLEKYFRKYVRVPGFHSAELPRQ